MVSKYLTIELIFLLPLVLAVAVPVIRRNETAELRFFLTALVISALLIFANMMFKPHGFQFPASVAFLLIVIGYAIHPTLISTSVSTLLGALAVTAAGARATAYADSNIGSFADRNYAVFVAAAGLSGGIIAVVLSQVAVRTVARRNAAANCVNRSGESGGI